MQDQVVSAAARVLQVLRDEFGATVPNDISPAAVGDNIVHLMREAIAGSATDDDDSRLTFISSGRITVVPNFDEGRLFDLDISVDIG